jgi:hypothetical protein
MSEQPEPGLESLATKMTRPEQRQRQLGEQAFSCSASVVPLGIVLLAYILRPNRSRWGRWRWAG